MQLSPEQQVYFVIANIVFVFALIIIILFVKLMPRKSEYTKRYKEELEQKIDPISHTLAFSQLLVDGTQERFSLFLKESEEARAEGNKEKELAAISKFSSYLHEWSKVLESRKQDHESVLAKT